MFYSNNYSKNGEHIYPSQEAGAILRMFKINNA
jgi:hypothetical protein